MLKGCFLDQDAARKQEPGFLADDPAKIEHGTGLGLIMVRRLVHQQP
jgi:hypothetical protein